MVLFTFGFGPVVFCFGAAQPCRYVWAHTSSNYIVHQSQIFVERVANNLLLLINSRVQWGLGNIYLRYVILRLSSSCPTSRLIRHSSQASNVTESCSTSSIGYHNSDEAIYMSLSEPQVCLQPDLTTTSCTVVRLRGPKEANDEHVFFCS